MFIFIVKLYQKLKKEINKFTYILSNSAILDYRFLSIGLF